jgi:hypothetical protein
LQVNPLSLVKEIEEMAFEEGLIEKTDEKSNLLFYNDKLVPSNKTVYQVVTQFGIYSVYMYSVVVLILNFFLTMIFTYRLAKFGRNDMAEDAHPRT